MVEIKYNFRVVFELLELSGQFTTSSVFHVYCDEGSPILGATLLFSVSSLHPGSPTRCNRCLSELDPIIPSFLQFTTDLTLLLLGRYSFACTVGLNLVWVDLKYH
jgi:hypothetical protein